MKASRSFLSAVSNAWGNPEAVADAGISELFRHDRNFDYDAQVRDAKRVGVLAGLKASTTPEEFVAAFEEQILGE